MKAGRWIAGAFLYLAFTSFGSGEDVVYFRDVGVGADRMEEALRKLGHRVSIAATSEDFAAALASDTYQLGVCFVQKRFASDYAPAIRALSQFVDRGGRALYADWSQHAELAALFGAKFSGRANARVATVGDLRPSRSAVQNPVRLRNTGWFQASVGLQPLPGSMVAAQFANGDAALVRGPTGRSLVFGFLNDTPETTHLFARAIDAVLGTPFAPDVADAAQVTQPAEDQAIVRGMVTSNYADTMVTIEYGQSAALGQESAPQMLRSAGAGQPVEFTLTDLTPRAVYYFRVRAANAAGIGTSRTFTFVTGNIPPRANDDVVTAATSEALVLHPLSNDRDANGNALRIISALQGRFGTVTFDDTSLTYTPTGTGLRTDSFTYTVADPAGALSLAMVRITLPPARFRGRYVQLLQNPAGLSGKLRLSVNGRGSFTGELRFGNRRTRLVGSFASDGWAHVSVPRVRAGNLTLALEKVLTETGGRLIGTLSDGVTVWNIDAGVVRNSAPMAAAPARITFQGASGHAEAWARTAPALDGSLRLAGRTQNAAFTNGAWAQADGAWPIFIPVAGESGRVIRGLLRPGEVVLRARRDP